MSDNINIATYEYKKDELSGTRYVEVSDTLNVDENVISREGLFKGFAYHVPTPKTLAGALQVFGGDEGAMIDALARTINNMVYIRAIAKLRNKLTQDQGKDEKVKVWQARHKDEIESLKKTDPVLFSIEDALNFRPGERELTPAGLVRQIGKAMTEATKLMSSGKLAEATKAFAKVEELTKRFQAINEQLQAQAAALDGEGGDETDGGN